MNIRQHEALRVPAGWNGQDRSLVMQIERVLTDLYRLMGIADSEMVTDVSYHSDTKKLTVTIGGKTSDIVSVATLDGNGKIPASQLPSYVDDVEEYADSAHFPATGESDKIYVALDTGFTYRWSGTQYVRLNTYDPATQSESGLMSAADKTKLDGIQAGAQVNPGDATTTASGLMSALDKTKLDGIETGANKTTVVDSLTSDSTTSALSAAQGKVLDGKFSYETVTNWNNFVPSDGNKATKRQGISTGGTATGSPFSGDNATFYGEVEGYHTYWTQRLTVQYATTEGNRNRQFIRCCLGSGATPTAWEELALSSKTEPVRLTITRGSSSLTITRGWAFRVGKTVFVNIVLTTSAQFPSGGALFKLTEGTKNIVPVIDNTGISQSIPLSMTFGGVSSITIGGVSSYDNHWYVQSGATIATNTTVAVVGSFICQ